MKLIAANWKKYLTEAGEASFLAQSYAQLPIPPDAAVVACPRFEHLAAVQGKLGGVALGAQDIRLEGEFDPDGLKAMGVAWVILGHSDSRAAGDTDAIVRQKMIKAVQAGLRIILCVGEQADVHAAGTEAVEQFVLGELEASVPLDDLDAGLAEGWTAGLTVAYEPIWAISKAGVGESDTPEDASRIIKLIKDFLVSRLDIAEPAVMYGGSVTSANAASFLARREIDGALVGHASLDAGQFQKILNAAGAPDSSS